MIRITIAIVDCTDGLITYDGGGRDGREADESHEPAEAAAPRRSV
jgi:hypothetical protein